MRLLAADAFFEAHEALPWVALGWALYGLFLVFVTIAGRAKVTTRTFPAAAAGLVVNVVALVAPRRAARHRRRRASRCARAYLVMLVVVHLLTRRLFAVPFEWARLGTIVAIIGGVSIAGELAAADRRASRASPLVRRPWPRSRSRCVLGTHLSRWDNSRRFGASVRSR